MATAVRVRFPPSAPARHQGLWQLAATLSFLVVSSSAASPARPLFFLPLRIWVKQVVQKVPQMPSAAASSAHPHGTCHSHPATRRSGQHLLCVGRIFYFRCALPTAAKKRLGNAEIRLSLGTCFRQEAKMLACQLFALLHASLPGVPDLPTLRDILRACLETSAFIVTRRHVDKKRLCAAAKTREDCQTVPQRSDGQRMGACTSSPAPCFWRRSEAQNRPA